MIGWMDLSIYGDPLIEIERERSYPSKKLISHNLQFFHEVRSIF
jgi:hypothetical protein